eukprot:31323-Pelagococcus_subviridis.AAC.22
MRDVEVERAAARDEAVHRSLALSRSHAAILVANHHPCRHRRLPRYVQQRLGQFSKETKQR